MNLLVMIFYLCFGLIPTLNSIFFFLGLRSNESSITLFIIVFQHLSHQVLSTSIKFALFILTIFDLAFYCGFIAHNFSFPMLTFFIE